MSLRIKIALLVLVSAFLATGYFVFYWGPQSERQSKETLVSFTESHLNTVSEGVLHPLLENRLASIHENLRALLAENPDWRAIELYDAEERRLFPAKAQARPRGESVQTLPLCFSASPWGRSPLQSISGQSSSACAGRTRSSPRC
jgi:hypothetical protein